MTIRCMFYPVHLLGLYFLHANDIKDHVAKERCFEAIDSLLRGFHIYDDAMIGKLLLVAFIFIIHVGCL